MSKECPFCKSAVPDEANFCLHCCRVINAQPFDVIPDSKEKNVSSLHRIKSGFIPKKRLFQDFFHNHNYKRIFPVLCMLAVTCVICLLVAAYPIRHANITTGTENETITVPVTTPDGEPVTDANGENVYEVIEVTTEAKGFLASLFSPDDSNQNEGKKDNNGSLFDRLFNQNQEQGEQNGSGDADSDSTSGSTNDPQEGTTNNTKNPTPSAGSEKPTDSNVQGGQSQGSSEGLVWTETNGKIKITGYNGNSSIVTVPAYIDGKRVSYLDENAFSNNSNIKEIRFQGSATGSERFYLPYGKAAFNNLPNLTAVTFPYETDFHMIKADGTLVQFYTFHILFTNCPKLSNVDFTQYVNKKYGTSREQFFISENGVILGQDTLNDSHYRSIVYYPVGKTAKSYTVPNNCSDIEDYAFWRNPYIETLTFSENVRYIDGPNFYGCGNLSSFIVNSANTKYRSENGVLYGGSLSVNSIKYTGVFYPPGKRDAYFELSNSSPIALDINSFCGNPYLETVRCPNDAYIFTKDIKSSIYGAKALKTIQISSKHSYRINDKNIFNVEYFE